MPYADLEVRRAFHREYMRKRRETSKSQRDYDSAHSKEYRRKNWPKIRTYYRAYNAGRKAEKKKACLDKVRYKDEIRRFYAECPEGYEVDHIVPLRGSDVSGLHVPWNLQYLSVVENREKSNKLVRGAGLQYPRYSVL